MRIVAFAILICFLICLPVPSKEVSKEPTQDSWIMFRHDTQHTGFSNSVGQPQTEHSGIIQQEDKFGPLPQSPMELFMLVLLTIKFMH